MPILTARVGSALAAALGLLLVPELLDAGDGHHDEQRHQQG
jgi:hypothetical protein